MTRWVQFLRWVASKLPYKTIGYSMDDPLLHRFYIYRGRRWGLFLHNLCRSDPDGLHDHPFAVAVSLILAGGYVEERRGGVLRELKPGQLNLIWGTDFHRLHLRRGHQAWTLFWHGPRNKPWGFLHPDGSYQVFEESVDRLRKG